jgi:hypothetical protein
VFADIITMQRKTIPVQISDQLRLIWILQGFYPFLFMTVIIIEIEIAEV